ncbi:hypothetical protein DY000_02010181 [Brassica cretica]|uniref:FLZ-type domain-containing protein n=1 Tax=Brassica cretica TaxID=69181 RepID=A0ABQ7BSS6_BRACR|nr:hypothetical protein DY000_02010181 [Brassica cretica]
MQSKINSFFKPSSPSPIAGSVTPETDGGLTAWENNRNVIVNTYERRSAKADSEVPKECIGKPPRKGPSFAPKTLNKKRCYTQFHLELGQSDFLLRHCVECRATYAPGDDGG